MLKLMRDRIDEATKIVVAKAQPVYTRFVMECASDIDFDAWFADNYDADWNIKPPTKDWQAESRLNRLFYGHES